jgi:citrate synthase
MLAGLAALSGPLQGTSNEQIDLFVNSTATLGVGNAIKHYVAFGKSVPGFGHELYPDGDERAIALLKKFDPPAHCLEVIEKVYLATGQRPNLDFAVFAMVRYLGLTKDAAFWLFALSRSVGWVAHSIEQTLQGGMIRPRARYEVGD